MLAQEQSGIAARLRLEETGIRRGSFPTGLDLGRITGRLLSYRTRWSPT